MPRRSGSPRLTGPERRKCILDAAEEAFASRGYAAASISAIAARAEVSKPVIYDHFKSKIELYERTLDRLREELQASGAAGVGGDDLESRGRVAVATFFEWVEAHPRGARLLFALPEGDPSVVAAAEAVQSRATKAIALLLEADFGPEAVPIAEWVKGGLHALALSASDRTSAERRRVAVLAADLMWMGIGGVVARGVS